MESIDGIAVIHEFIMYSVCICVENVDILKFIFIFWFVKECDQW